MVRSIARLVISHLHIIPLDKQHEKVFLVVIGSALIVEAFLTQDVPGLLPEALPIRVVAAVVFGLAIGLVRSLLGVAGGEPIIPTLVFAFGAGIKAAGTASLLVSLPTVAVGIVPAAALKLLLGTVLIVSAVRIFRGRGRWLEGLGVGEQRLLQRLRSPRRAWRVARKPQRL